MLDTAAFPSPDELKIKPNATLSEAFDYWHDREIHRFQSEGVIVPKESARFLLLTELVEELEEWISMVPDGQLNNFIDALTDRAGELINSYGYQSTEVVWERGLEIERLFDRMDA